jgi:hypothetical protein
MPNIKILFYELPNLLSHFNELSDKIVPKLLENYNSKHMIHKMDCLIDNPMGPKVSESPRKFLISCCKVYSLQQEITPWMMVYSVIKQQRLHVLPPILRSAHRHAIVESVRCCSSTTMALCRKDCQKMTPLLWSFTLCHTTHHTPEEVITCKVANYASWYLSCLVRFLFWVPLSCQIYSHEIIITSRV